MGFGLQNDLMTTQLGTTNDYSATANPHTLQITAMPTKSFPVCYVFINHSLATASNSGDSSASVLTSLLSGKYSTTVLCHPCSASFAELN
jgi:hypothetical protein